MPCSPTAPRHAEFGYNPAGIGRSDRRNSRDEVDCLAIREAVEEEVRGDEVIAAARKGNRARITVDEVHARRCDAAAGKLNHAGAKVDAIYCSSRVVPVQFHKKAAVAIADYQRGLGIAERTEKFATAALQSVSECRIFKPAIPSRDAVAVHVGMRRQRPNPKSSRGVSNETSAKTRRASSDSRALF